MNAYPFGDPFALVGTGLGDFDQNAVAAELEAAKAVNAAANTADAATTVQAAIKAAVAAVAPAAIADPGTGEMPDWVVPVAIAGGVAVIVGAAVVISKKSRKRNPRRRRQR